MIESLSIATRNEKKRGELNEKQYDLPERKLVCNDVMMNGRYVVNITAAREPFWSG